MIKRFFPQSSKQGLVSRALELTQPPTQRLVKEKKRIYVDRPEAGHHTVTLAPGLQDRASEILKEEDRAVTYGHRAPYLHQPPQAQLLPKRQERSSKGLQHHHLCTTQSSQIACLTGKFAPTRYGDALPLILSYQKRTSNSSPSSRHDPALPKASHKAAQGSYPNSVT